MHNRYSSSKLYETFITDSIAILHNYSEYNVYMLLVLGGGTLSWVSRDY